MFNRLHIIYLKINVFVKLNKICIELLFKLTE